MLAALGLADRIVGVDDYSEFPPQVKKLPKVGSFLAPNLEQIVALRPTLVIVDDVHGPSAGAMRDAGLVTMECAIHALPDVKKALELIGTRLGRTAEAKATIDRIDAAIEQARAKRPAKRPRVLAILDREAGGLGSLVAAGPGSWIDELIAIVGGENVLASAGVRYPKISMEEVIRSQPDVILDLSYAARGRNGVDAWSAADVPAVKTKRVVALTEPFFTAPSPRVHEALDALVRVINP
ncbi:MAG: periplasmic binding protein [Myxococcales bacterium]|nr:periplasmic binding protein [Myxococcales bacterium]